jgi:hypothetical protein
MPPPTVAGLLLRLPSGAGERLALDGAGRRIQAGDLDLELKPLFQASTPGPALAGGGAEWFVARNRGDAAVPVQGWEAAYDLMQRAGVLGAVGTPPSFVEPDFIQDWPHARGTEGAALAGGFDDQEDRGGRTPTRPGRFAWHLDDDFTQLRAARTRAAGGGPVRIAHLDTGYDPEHSTFPANQVDRELQRNFVDSDRPNDARDRAVTGMLKNPGHGTGTLSILAGARFTFQGNGYQFDDILGGAPDARIVPIRVGNSVVQLSTSSVARGLAYATDLCRDPQTRVDVISMSMGGLASAAWADAVNAAYAAGVVFVAAAGQQLRGAAHPLHCFPRALQSGCSCVRGHGRLLFLQQAAAVDHAGVLGTCWQDGNGSQRLHTQHRLGGTRCSGCCRYEWRGDFVGDAADCRCGSALFPDARPNPLRPEPLPHALDASRGGAPGSLHFDATAWRFRAAREGSDSRW